MDYGYIYTLASVMKGTQVVWPPHKREGADHNPLARQQGAGRGADRASGGDS